MLVAVPFKNLSITGKPAARFFPKAVSIAIPRAKLPNFQTEPATSPKGRAAAKPMAPDTVFPDRRSLMASAANQALPNGPVTIANPSNRTPLIFSSKALHWSVPHRTIAVLPLSLLLAFKVSCPFVSMFVVGNPRTYPYRFSDLRITQNPHTAPESALGSSLHSPTAPAHSSNTVPQNNRVAFRHPVLSR